jgi:hypothetical protein
MAAASERRDDGEPPDAVSCGGRALKILVVGDSTQWALYQVGVMLITLLCHTFGCVNHCIVPGRCHVNYLVMS